MYCYYSCKIFQSPSLIGSNPLANSLDQFEHVCDIPERDGKPQAPQGRSGAAVREDLQIIAQYLDLRVAPKATI